MEAILVNSVSMGIEVSVGIDKAVQQILLYATASQAQQHSMPFLLI